MATLLNNDVILIVDDSKFIAQSYSRVAMSLGYRVLIACDGKTGLFAAESCKPSLILLDVAGVRFNVRSTSMPSISGIRLPKLECWTKRERQDTLKKVP
jgi:DNA-binding NtrC family response regulator